MKLSKFSIDTLTCMAADLEVSDHEDDDEELLNTIMQELIARTDEKTANNLVYLCLQSRFN